MLKLNVVILQKKESYNDNLGLILKLEACTIKMHLIYFSRWRSENTPALEDAYKLPYYVKTLENFRGRVCNGFKDQSLPFTTRRNFLYTSLLNFEH